MEFFDPKEDVMDIQLTQYGKYLLSQGLFKPIYYSFHDDDILYDDAYVNDSIPQEAQNQSAVRITGSTPRPKVYSVFSGIETEVARNNRLVRYGEVLSAEGAILKVDKEKIGSQALQPTPERIFAFANPIGTGGSRTNYAPSWSIKFLQGELSSSAAYLASDVNKHEILNIPQITSSLIYDTFEVSDEDFAAYDDADASEPGELGFSPSVTDSHYSILTDGTPVFTRENSIILEIIEENVDLTNENFDIEVFKMEQDSKGNVHAESLSFIKKEERIVNGILLDEDQFHKPIPGDDETYVHYYFDVNVDCEIDFSKINKNIEKTRGIYLSGLPCLPTAPFGGVGQPTDMYGKLVDDAVKDCD